MKESMFSSVQQTKLSSIDQGAKVRMANVQEASDGSRGGRGVYVSHALPGRYSRGCVSGWYGCLIAYELPSDVRLCQCMGRSCIVTDSSSLRSQPLDEPILAEFRGAP